MSRVEIAILKLFFLPTVCLNESIMNYYFKINTIIVLAGIVILLSCIKNPANTSIEPHIIRGQIVEYGTGSPIAGAASTIWINARWQNHDYI
jgi:hypothetical protein